MTEVKIPAGIWKLKINSHGEFSQRGEFPHRDFRKMLCSNMKRSHESDV